MARWEARGCAERHRRGGSPRRRQPEAPITEGASAGCTPAAHAARPAWRLQVSAILQWDSLVTINVYSPSFYDDLILFLWFLRIKHYLLTLEFYNLLFRREYGYLGPSLQQAVSKIRTSPSASSSGGAVAVVTCTPPLVPSTPSLATTQVPHLSKPMGEWLQTVLSRIYSDVCCTQHLRATTQVLPHLLNPWVSDEWSHIFLACSCSWRVRYAVSTRLFMVPFLNIWVSDVTLS